MTHSFVHTEPGVWVNLARVDTLRRLRNGNYEVTVDGRVVDDNCPGPDETIVQIVPNDGGWELLSLCDAGTPEMSVYVEPIIAWGLTPFGVVVPVTPMEPAGDHGEVAYRGHGDPRIFTIFRTYVGLGRSEVGCCLAPMSARVLSGIAIEAEEHAQLR